MDLGFLIFYQGYIQNLIPIAKILLFIKTTKKLWVFLKLPGGYPEVVWGERECQGRDRGEKE